VVKENVFVKVRLGKYVVKIPMLVANINDDCIIGVDFLKEIYLENIFKTIFSKHTHTKRNSMWSFRKFSQSFIRS